MSSLFHNSSSFLCNSAFTLVLLNMKSLIIEFKIFLRYLFIYFFLYRSFGQFVRVDLGFKVGVEFCSDCAVYFGILALDQLSDAFTAIIYLSQVTCSNLTGF